MYSSKVPMKGRPSALGISVNSLNLADFASFADLTLSRERVDCALDSCERVTTHLCANTRMLGDRLYSSLFSKIYSYPSEEKVGI